MKRILKKSNIFAFILGAVIFGSIGVAASEIFASSITYKNTNVESALDELYTISSTYKNLNTTTTATSSDILNGKTAYDNNGNIITGNVNADCVKGSFVWTQNEKDNGIVLASFTPSLFSIHAENPVNGEFIYYYNSNISNQVTQTRIKDDEVYYTFVNIGSGFRINNNLELKFSSSDWLNQQFYYMICK